MMIQTYEMPTIAKPGSKYGRTREHYRRKKSDYEALESSPGKEGRWIKSGAAPVHLSPSNTSYNGCLCTCRPPE